MNAGTEMVERALGVVKGVYISELWAIPLVLAGFFTVGVFYYYVLVRPHLAPGADRSLLRYLFPKEHYVTRSARVDMWVYVVNSVFVAPFLAVLIVMLSAKFGVDVNKLIVRVLGPDLHLVRSLWAAVAVQSLCYYFGAGFAQYTGHLAYHKVPFMWALHRAHHSAESSNPFTFSRSHPIEIISQAIYRVVCGAAGLGLGIFLTGGTLRPETTTLLLVAGLFNVVAGFRSLDHTHIPVSYGKFLNVIWGGPVLHQIHHSAEEHQRDVNLAGAGYIYDWLFGTLYLPKKGETWRWGLNERELGENNPHNTLKDFLVEPIISMGRELAKLIPGSRRGVRADTPAE